MRYRHTRHVKNNNNLRTLNHTSVVIKNSIQFYIFQISLHHLGIWIEARIQCYDTKDCVYLDL